MQEAVNTGKFKNHVSPNTDALLAKDKLRAQIYRLLASFLSALLKQNDLQIATGLDGDKSELGEPLPIFRKLQNRWMFHQRTANITIIS